MDPVGQPGARCGRVEDVDPGRTSELPTASTSPLALCLERGNGDKAESEAAAKENDKTTREARDTSKLLQAVLNARNAGGKVSFWPDLNERVLMGVM